MLIALGRTAQVGKDTIGEILIKNHGFKRYAFADILKQALYNLNPDIPVYLGNALKDISCVQGLVDNYGWELCKTKFPKIRVLLQRMGTEVGRQLFGENFWIDHTFQKMEKDGAIGWDDSSFGFQGCIHYENLVITDCRFDNEAKAVKDRGGVYIEVTRKGVKPPNNHPSEQGISEHLIDGYIRNDGTLEELEQGVAEMVKFLQNENI